MKKVVIVNGRPRAGKDTSVQFMRAILKDHGVQSMEYSSVDPVRAMLARSDIDVTAKTPADRALLAEIKSSLEKHSGYPTRQCVSVALRFFQTIHQFNGVVFLYVREPESIEQIKRFMAEAGHDTITIIVQSNRAEHVTSNAADLGVETMHYDARLSNNGSLEVLNANCRCLLHTLDMLPSAEALP